MAFFANFRGKFEAGAGQLPVPLRRLTTDRSDRSPPGRADMRRAIHAGRSFSKAQARNPYKRLRRPMGPRFSIFKETGSVLPDHPRWEAGASVQGSLQRIFEAFPWVPAAEAARPVGVSAISSSAADSSIGLSRYFRETDGIPSLSGA